MKIILNAGLCGLLALGGVLATSSGYAKTVHVDDKFDNMFAPSNLDRWVTHGARIDNLTHWEVKEEDPNGTSNKSVRITGGSIRRGGASAADDWSNLAAIPTNQSPIVFSFYFYDYGPEVADITEPQRTVYGELQRGEGLTPLFAAGLASSSWDAGGWATASAPNAVHDTNRYQARVFPGINWFQLNTERSIGWQKFTFVIRATTFDIYVNDVLDPNAVDLPWAGLLAGQSFSELRMGGGFATVDLPARFDNVYFANDPSFARAINIESGPVNTSAIVGTTGTLTVNVSGATGSTQFQWFKGETAVENNGRITGATTATLTISNAQFSDTGQYRLRVTDGSTVLNSAFADFRVLQQPPAPTGIRWADFEAFGAPANGTVMFQIPSFSGSNRLVVTTAPNDQAQVLSAFPEGTWGERAMRLRFGFRARNPEVATENTWMPWLRLTTNAAASATNLRNPIMYVDRYLRFDMHTNQDVWVSLGVRETNSTGDLGTNGGATGPIEWVGGNDAEAGSAERANTAGHPPFGVLVKAGAWREVYFHIPTAFIKGFAGTGVNGQIDSSPGMKGVLEHLVFQPVHTAPGEWTTQPFDIFVDNFESTEVGPTEPPVDSEPPTVSIARSNGQITLTINGAANASHTVEVSNDLITWTSAGTVTLSGEGSATHVDSDTAGANRRFYRVR
jgi:hypothetical protein